MSATASRWPSSGRASCIASPASCCCTSSSSRTTCAQSSHNKTSSRLRPLCSPVAKSCISTHRTGARGPCSSRTGTTRSAPTSHASHYHWSAPCKTWPTTFMMIILVFLLTFAHGQGQGPDEAARPPVDELMVFNIREGLPAGTEVGRINVQSGLRYKFSDDPGVFHLNPETGRITTTTVLDRENLGAREDRFDLFVSSTPSARHLIEVRINVLDVNDNSPRFGQPSIKVTFSERDQPGTQIILETATDKDVGPNDVTNKYYIINESEDIRRKFTLILLTDTSKPLLYLENLVQLDREEKSLYHLNISAQDGGNPPRFGYLQVNISVTDINDNPPLFDQSDYSASINETSLPGSSVVQVRATDQDAGDNADITYRLINDDLEQFTIDRKTGIINTAKKLLCQQSCRPTDLPGSECHRKSCVITVEARDGGQPPQLGRAYVTVSLIDENDHDPIITFDYPSGQGHKKYGMVNEGSKEDSIVAIVSVTDSDEGLNGQTSVRISRGNERAHFRLDSKGRFNFIRVAGKLDRERVNRYNLTLEAKDLGVPQRTATAHLIIVVNDVNDHRPVFKQSSYSARLSELVPVGSFVASITATDNDTGINAQISYSIVGGDRFSWFHIDNSTGLVTTKANLDHEKSDSLFLRIVAEDGGSTPFQTYTNLSVTIWDENDEVPTFSQSEYHIARSEIESANTEVISLTASDNDQGKNGTVTYRLEPTVERLYPATFSIGLTTGRLVALKVLDREEHARYRVEVTASDGGRPSLSSTATVYINVTDVNDNAPMFYPLEYYVSILENMPAYTHVVQVSATDEDAGNNAVVHYRLAYAQSVGGKFSIDVRTGRISTAQQLDREQQASYSLQVIAEDQGNPQRTAPRNAQVYITVNDVQDSPPEFSIPGGYSFTIQEDNANSPPRLGRMVGRVIATTKDVSAHISYAITSGDKRGVFTINSDTGVISVVQSVDREQASSYHLVVVATGAALHGHTVVNVTVADLNDNTPAFGRTSAMAYVVENWPVGHQVYLADAQDADDSENGRLSYSLTASQQSARLFQVEPTTGMIYLAESLTDLSPRPVQFKVSVTATDAGRPPKTASLDVTIVVRDVNDHTPVFEQASYEITVSEAQQVNEHIYKVTATDDDAGLNGELTYFISNTNVDSPFGIFPDGVLYVAKSLDREKQDFYLLTVVVEDKGVEPRRSDVNISIYIRDANDNRPVFSNFTYQMGVTENQPVGTYVGTVTATDVDLGLNGEVTYSIDGVQRNFEIHPTTGVITTRRIFDREALLSEGGPGTINVVVIAMDGGEERQKEQAVVSIRIVDSNDNTPQFIQDVYRPSLYENTQPNTQVVRVSATDQDEGLNAKISYSIIQGNDGDVFSIDTASGQVMLSGVLDREVRSEYRLVVLASDSGKPHSLNSTAVVEVSVSDNNDNAPEFEPHLASYSVLETARVGALVAHVQASDADLGRNAELTYAISTGNVDTTFHVDANTGKLYVAKPLDFEARRMYNLTLTATDQGTPRLSAQTSVAINILDLNDNAPAFDTAPVIRQIEEGVQVGTSITVMRASDPDSGINGEVRYSILRQEPASVTGELLFSIDPLTGRVTTAGPIDRETAPTYRLTVVAHDQAMPANMRRTAEKVVTVVIADLNDNAPHFVSMNAVAILLGTRPQTKIGSVQAIDLDEAEAGEVQYELLAGDTTYFRIDSDNGDVYVQRDLGTQAKVFTLTVRARDRGIKDRLGTKSTDQQLSIFTRSNVANGPVFTSASYSEEVYENAPADTSVLIVSTDQQNVEYYITRITAANIDQARYFQVHPTSGLLSTTEVLDREKGFSDFEITLYAVDRGSPTPRTRTTQVLVRLLDENDSAPMFIPSEFETSVSEDVTPGYNVINVIATDADTDQATLLYQIVGGNDDGTFSIDATQGTLTLIRPLDRETKNEYNVMVEASDNVHTTRTRVRIHVDDVNDVTPAFDKSVYAFNLAENTPSGTTVGRVSALDADLAKNGQVSYSLLTQWGRHKFSLSPNSGVITLTASLDYEQVQYYSLVVQAKDAGQPPLSSTVTVFINVIDINDNTPVFDPGTYSDEVAENAPVSTSILTVTATDIDSGINGEMQYSIVGGDKHGDFAMDADTGEISTAHLLDREQQAYYTLTVMAMDKTVPPSPQHSTTTMVTIILTDINDNAPEFVSLDAVRVLENLPAGTGVFTVSATDRDEGRNGYVEYQLSPTSADLFTLDPVDGVLQVNRKLDRETQDEYQIEVVATDKGNPALSTTTMMRVVVEDDNDNTPEFEPKVYSHETAENVKVGTNLLTLTASDRDIGPNADIRYAIVNGDDNEDFRLDSHTGELFTMKRLDYERQQKYTLTVKAEDQGLEPRSDTATVTIVVTDVNDNAPTFINLPYVAYVQENLSRLPVHVVRMRARDPDTGWGGRTSYAIMNGDRSLFSINSTSGEIVALRPLDREQRSSYVLTVRAVDSGSPRLSSTAEVTVVVQDVNDETPYFQHSRYAARIAENDPPPKYITRVSASDADQASNAKITYRLADTMGGRFSVQRESGEIYAARMLNREERDTYDLVVVASDSGLLSRSSSALVHVTIEDKNNNSPRFTRTLYTAYIRDPTAQGMFVMGVTAVDPDLGDNGHIVYSLLGGSDRANFIIDSETGIITASRRLTGADRTSRRYLLQVRATDRGQNPLSVDARVEVLLLAVTLTGFPSVSATQRAFRLSELVRVGHVLTTVRATTTQPDVTLAYRIAGGNIDQSFAITQDGKLQVNRPLDYERTHNYNLWIEVYDDGQTSLSDFVSIDVVVEDKNDNPPVFEKTFYEVTVKEEEHPPNSVIRVTATDADSDENGRITYEIVRGNEDEAFDIDRSQGQIRTNRQLDRETRSNYSLEVRATDHGQPPFTAVTIVDITVADINDKPPVFTQHFQDTRIPENIPIGTSILKITSSDGDVGSNTLHSYSFTSNPGGRFSIDRSSGVVSVAASLDYETKNEYILQVSTNDGAHNADTPVTIRVTDVNDNAPRFSRSSYRFSLLAGAPPRTRVGQVSATDADAASTPNSDVYFRFKKSTSDFSVDGETGEIFSRRPVAYKEAAGRVSPENVHRLVVVAADRGEPAMTRDVSVVVVVQQPNLHEPIFDKSPYTAAVPETAPIGHTVTILSARDELADGSLGEIEYLEVDGNGTSFFEVNRKTGEVTVATSVSGQRGRRYTLNVVARDLGEPPLSASTKILITVADVNRNKPRFLGPPSAFQVTVPESTQVQQVIATVRASDADSGNNGLVSFYITGGDPHALFSIDESQGVIRLVKTLDYEKNKTHVLNVTASDRGLLPRATSTSFTVHVTDVNDNAPVFVRSQYEAFITENKPSGTRVFVANATDADSEQNAIVDYSIIGSVAAMDKFSIHPTGVITSQGSIDYEVRHDYELVIKAMNPGTSLSSTATVHVNVLGTNEFVPQFEQAEYQFVVSESARPGDVVGVVHADDQDAGPDGQVFYSLIGDSNLRGFRMDRVTGEVSIASKVDRESTSEIMLDVLAKNQNAIRGNDTATCRVRVLIRDANDPPIFTSQIYRVSIPEDARLGQSIIQVVASDSDLQSDFRDFTYTVRGSSTPNKPLPFSIDRTTGVVSVDGKLDREVQPQHNITVLATDSGSPPMTGSATVWVTLEDVNDNGPYFQPKIPEGYVTENKAPYTEVIMDLSIYTKDPDLRPSQGPFKYKLLDHTDKFEVLFTAALVKAKTRLDRETNSEYLLRLEVSDNGTPTMTSTLTARVVVKDENDNPSSPRPLQVLVYAYNGSFPGGHVGDVRPLDPDTTGDWQCRISQGDLSVLQIKSACRLDSTRVVSGRQFNLNISGSDGIHQPVDYSTNIKYVGFTHHTVDSSVNVKVGVNKAEYFLASFYAKFEAAVQKVVPTDATVMIFGLSNTQDFTVLQVAVRRADGDYVSRSRLLQTLQTNLDTIERETGLVVDSVNYNPCDEAPCANSAECTFKTVVADYSSTDSAALILTTPHIELLIQCKCQSGFTGPRCESPVNRCDDSLCKNGGTCLSATPTARCLCRPGWRGAVCGEDVNECAVSQPCRNGATCYNSAGSYSCSCLPQYAGNNCQYKNNHCASAPCLNNAQCISTPDGFQCACTYGQRGARCEVSSLGFQPLSYMEYSLPWDRRTNSIHMEFATVDERALLLFGAGSSTKGKGEFIAVEIIGGQVRFSYALGDGSVTRLTVPRRVNDGLWHRIQVDRNGKVGTLRVTDCPQGETVCRPCEDGDPSCYVREEHTGLFSELQLTNDRISVGGVRSINVVLTNRGQVAAFDFVGCIRAAAVNEVDVLTMTPESTQGVVDGCVRREPRLCSPSVCRNDGVCVDEWDAHRCDCPAGFSGPDCAQESIPFAFGPNSMVVYRQKEAYAREQIFDSHSAQRRRRRQALQDPHSVSVTFRTSHQEGLLFYSASQTDYTTIQVYEGQVLYHAEVRGQTYKLPAPGDVKVADSKWHNVTVIVKGSVVSMSLDDLSTNKAFASQVHNPLDLQVTELHLGGTSSQVRTPDGSRLVKGFEGCMSELRLDGTALPFSGRTQRFVAEPVGGGGSNASCSAAYLGANGSAVGMHPAIIVVIVFFALVLLAIGATFLVIRMRRRNKEAADKESKMNGNAVVSKTNGLMADKTNESRSHQDSGFTENGEMSEEAIIQQHVQRELASRSFSEREIRDPFNGSRPDLVSPEMGGMDGIGVDNNGYAEEPPEHYDIDAASSIAPSDLVDVTAHYKRYRQSGGMGNNKHQQYNVPVGQPASRARLTPSPANVLGKSYGIPRDSPLTVGLHHQHHRQSPAANMSTPLGRAVSPHHHHHHSSRQNTPNSMSGPLNNLSRTSPAVLDQRTTSPLSHNQLSRNQSPSVLAMRDKRMSPLPAGANSLRSTPVNGLYPSNASNSSAAYSHNGHGPPRPSSRLKQPIQQMAALRATPTRGLTVEDVERLNGRSKPSPVSTLDVGSSSSDEAPPRKNLIARARTPVSPFDPGRALQMEPPPDSSSDDGSNDSFTCSEFEYENDKVKNEYTPNRATFPKLAEVSENDDTDVSRTFTPNGSDSNREGSLSTFFSDDDAPKTSNKLLNGALNWDYLLNWGPNFEKLVGVFKDIAELPDGSSGINTDVKPPQQDLQNQSPQPSQQQHQDNDVEFRTAEPTNAEVREEYV